MTDGTNGEHGQSAKPSTQMQLVLDFDATTFQLKIGGTMPNWDAAAAILEQAKRYVDVQLRLIAAQNFQAQAAEAMRVQKIVDSIRREN